MPSFSPGDIQGSDSFAAAAMVGGGAYAGWSGSELVMFAASFLGYATLTGEGIEPTALRAELSSTVSRRGVFDWGGTLMPKEGETVAIKAGDYRLEMPDGRSSSVLVSGVRLVSHGRVTRQEFRVAVNEEPPPFD